MLEGLPPPDEVQKWSGRDHVRLSEVPRKGGGVLHTVLSAG